MEQIFKFLKQKVLITYQFSTVECRQAYYSERKSRILFYNTMYSTMILLTILKQFLYLRNHKNSPEWNSLSQDQQATLIRNNYLLISQVAVASLLLIVYTVTCHLATRRLPLLQQFQSSVFILIGGIGTYPYLNVGFQYKDFLLFHQNRYIFVTISIIQNCDQWRITWFLFICYFSLSVMGFQIKNGGLTNSAIIQSIVTAAILLGIFMADTDYQQKRTFDDKFKNRARKQEYQILIDNFPEGIMIVSQTSGNTSNLPVTFLNQTIRSFLNISDSSNEDCIEQGLNLPLFQPYQADKDSPFLGLKQIINEMELVQTKYFEAVIENDKEGHQKSLLEIQKKDIYFQTTNQSLIVIRNVSHIIKQEKIKNRSHYLELLAGTVSHEMMTPLNSIINLAGFICEGFDEHKDTSFIDPEHIKVIHRSSLNLHYLIKDLLDLLRIQRGTFEPQIDSQVNPISACKETFDLLQNQSEQKAVKMVIERCSFKESQLYTFDKDRFKQVLLNLLANSVKFSTKGTIKVDFRVVRRSESQRNLSFSTFLSECKDCGVLETKVIDEGEGISQERLDKIFELFSRAEEEGGGLLTTQGIGLGLTVCKQITELLGGRFSICSVLGEGTQASFTMEIKCDRCYNDIFWKEESPGERQTTSKVFVSSPVSQVRMNIMKQRAIQRKKESIGVRMRIKKKDSYIQGPFSYKEALLEWGSERQKQQAVIEEESKRELSDEASGSEDSFRVDQSRRKLRNSPTVFWDRKQNYNVHQRGSITLKNCEKIDSNEDSITIDAGIEETARDNNLDQKYSNLVPLSLFQQQEHPSHHHLDEISSSISFECSVEDRNSERKEQSPVMEKQGGCGCEATILIVDDNALNLIPLELILASKFKVKVEKAMNGQQAWEMFEKNLFKCCCQLKYKAVLMDINMPVLDGYGATLKIKEIIANFNLKLGVPYQCPVVAITAYDNEQNIQKCFDCGMIDVIRKPVSYNALKATLNAIGF